MIFDEWTISEYVNSTNGQQLFGFTKSQNKHRKLGNFEIAPLGHYKFTVTTCRFQLLLSLSRNG
jgi:hypothetical protein